MLDQVTLKMGWSAISPRGSCLVLLRRTSMSFGDVLSRAEAAEGSLRAR